MDVVFVPRGLTKAEIVRHRRKMLRGFYLRPKIIGSYLGRILCNPRLLPGVLKGFLAFLRAVFGRGGEKKA